MQQEINYNYTKLTFIKLKKSTIAVYNELAQFQRFSFKFSVNWSEEFFENLKSKPTQNLKEIIKDIAVCNL